MKTLQILLTLAALLVAAYAADTPTANPPKPKTSTAKPAKPKPELPKTGINLPRPAGGWINAEIAGIRLVVKFFDKEKKPVPPDVERGFARFNYAVKSDRKAVLGREGNTLATPATVRPPHNFQVILSLFAGEGTQPTESYTFRYP
ncbi:MAG: hypothetical protein HYX71_02005 [Opitutae bacterium]|nr:hypothetical protein [Opitutae bacterium]